MTVGLPRDLKDYVQARQSRQSLNDRQIETLAELAEDMQDNERVGPDEFAARYVRRCLKAGWKSRP